MPLILALLAFEQISLIERKRSLDIFRVFFEYLFLVFLTST